MKKFFKTILNIHDVTVDAGGVNRSNGYVINAYSNTLETSGNDFSPEQGVFYSKVFIKNLTGKLIHQQFGDKETYPPHNGGIVNIRGITPYPTATTPLEEGVTPPGNQMNFYYVEVPVNQYGAYTPITDWAQFASRDDILVKDAEELSSQASRTLEEISREVLNGGTSFIYAPAVASDGTVTEVTTRKGITKLCKMTVNVANRALNYLECQNAEPIGDHYAAIIHPNVKFDIINDPNFINVMKYAHTEKLLRGEIGVLGNTRYTQSTFAKVFKGEGAEGTDVYSTLYFGKDAYKVLEIEGQGMKNIIKPLGSGGSTDPLNQRASSGWKTTFGIGIVSQTRMVRVESASSLNTQTA